MLPRAQGGTRLSPSLALLSAALLSNVAFIFKLLCYTKAEKDTGECFGPQCFRAACGICAAASLASVVGRCRLAVSKPVLKAPMVPALDTGLS